MGWSKVKDLAVVVSKYTDGEGKEKSRYRNVGQILQDDSDPSRQMIMLDRSFNPAGAWFKPGSEQVILNDFDPKERGEKHQPAQRQESAKSAPTGPETDDIPF